MTSISEDIDNIIRSAQSHARQIFKGEIISAIYEEIDTTLPAKVTKEMTDIKHTEIDCGEKIRQALRRVLDKLTKED